MNLSYISIKTLILVSSIALTACGGGGGGSNDDNDDSASDDPGAGTTEAIEKFFFHTYANSGSFPLNSGSSANHLGFKIRSTDSSISVEYLVVNTPSTPSASLKIIELDNDGATIATDVELNISDLDAVPADWLGSRIKNFARTSTMRYWTAIDTLSPGTPLRITEYLSGASGGTFSQFYDLSYATPSTGRYYGRALLALSNGKYAGIWLYRNDADTVAEKMYIEWINTNGTSDGTLELDVSYAFQYPALTLIEASDGGLLIAGTYLSNRNVTLPLGGTAKDMDAHVMKISSARQLEWETDLADIDWVDTITSISETPDGNVLLSNVGHRAFGFLIGPSTIYELSPFGGILKQAQIAVPDHAIYDITKNADGSYLATGSIFSSFYNARSLFISKLDENLTFTDTNVTP